ncbi:hypothetical protein PG993_006595 [Apiospora rasikravindrae]|uniref:DUF397 domain-containing protein n=1 Tax=Apiospora rasikravindrae TaxID=990691 RepID=A0ABR1T663_9PEZI
MTTAISKETWRVCSESRSATRRAPYAPTRGSGLEHLVTDFQGSRFFTVSTNHESLKKCA